MSNGGDRRESHGINEVRLRRGEIVRERMQMTFSDLRRLGRSGWQKLCPEIAILYRERERKTLLFLEALLWHKPFGKIFGAVAGRLHQDGPHGTRRVGRYMFECFDCAIADEIHQLAGDTAHANAPGT